VAGETRSVAVLGAGIMGAPMARNLLAAGLEVSVWNRTRERAGPLAEDGATVAGSAAEAVSGADAVLTVLADGDAVLEVIEGAGVLEAMGEGATWLQMSTVGLAATERLQELAGDAAVGFVDAPVLGTKAPAEQGELIVLASGPDELLDRARPVFEAVGSRTVALGAAGNGSRMKLIVNSWLLGLTTVLAETLAIADALGIDGKRFLDAIEGGPMDVKYAHMKGGMMLERSYEPSFPLRLALKDARLILDAADDADLNVGLVEAAERRLADADETGHSDDDMAAVYEAASPREDERPAAAP
jgi:3-hydroxyisobutyrate dehydrogenase